MNNLKQTVADCIKKRIEEEEREFMNKLTPIEEWAKGANETVAKEKKLVGNPQLIDEELQKLKV